MIARHTGSLLDLSRLARNARSESRGILYGRTALRKLTRRRMREPAWHGFRTGLWQKEINVRDFIQQNYEPYDGDESFLAPATRAHAKNLGTAARSCSSRSGRRACSTSHRSRVRSPRTPPAISIARTKSSSAFRPRRRSSAPSCRMAVFAWSSTRSRAYGYEPDPHVVEAFTKYRKTHNDAVFDAYTADIRRCRSSHILTGLPDAYGRGRIIGDYRRVPLYGVTRLIERKQRGKRTRSMQPCRPTRSFAIAKN